MPEDAESECRLVVCELQLKGNVNLFFGVLSRYLVHVSFVYPETYEPTITMGPVTSLRIRQMCASVAVGKFHFPLGPAK